MPLAQGSTMFLVQLNNPAHPIDCVVFVLLGVLGALVGAFFCWGNIEFNKSRHPIDTNSRRFLRHSLHLHLELSHAMDGIPDNSHYLPRLAMLKREPWRRCELCALHLNSSSALVSSDSSR